MDKLKLIVLLFIIFIIGCEDIIEPDLSNDIVILLSPPDGHQTAVSTQTFWWEELEKAQGYNLQVVSPTFDYIERLFVDTNLQVNKYTMTLLPGEYEWRVRAYNNTTSTDYTTYSFSIDSTVDISQEIIQLMYPYDFDTSNLLEKQFSWIPLYNADNYNFQLYFENQIVYSDDIEYDTLTLNLADGEGRYKWEVRGQNTYSNTIYSSRNMFIDTTSPAKPLLILPENNASLADSIILFSWTSDNSYGSSVTDSFYVYDDENLNSIVIHEKLTQTTYSDSLGPGLYYWKVVSTDAAGNISLPSNTRSLTIESKY
jgi:hypothetical protein